VTGSSRSAMAPNTESAAMRANRKVSLGGLVGLLWVAVLTIAACKPLRQQLGSIAAPTPTGAAGTGAAGSPGTPTNTQIPSLKAEWGACNPAVLRCYQDPALSPSSPVSGLFSGLPDPDPNATPVIVYPLAGSMHPINLADITFQWRRGPGAAQTLFRIRARKLSKDTFEFYVPCNDASTQGGVPQMDLECVYHMPPGAWIDLATAAHGESVTVDIAGVDPTRPGIVATSEPMTISFSPEYVAGGFYYWSTSIQGAMRLLFGGRPVQQYIVRNTPTTNPSDCSGCHTVSRDGSTMAFTHGRDPDGALRVIETADATKPLFPPATSHDSGMTALNRDGSRVLVSYQGKLVLRDTATGNQLGEVPSSFLGSPRRGYHPEWSPDDKQIVLTLSSDGTNDVTVSTGGIGILPYNDGAFGPVEEIVSATMEFNFYPTWSPDGHWIAFATAPVVGGQTSYRQPQARLRLVNRDTLTIYELKKATVAMGRTATFPKFAPIAQSGGLMFLTFNSKNDYGFFVRNNADGSAQLWITSIDPAKLHQATDDPSTAPVWLPFQSARERNYLGSWSERIGCRVDGAGTSVGCGVNEVCSNGACAMVTP
jgi:hypothetical protein